MKNQNKNLQYVGSFSTLTSEVKPMMNYGNPIYTEEQNRLYSRLLIGLKVYTPTEVYAMNSTKKNRIKKAHYKAQNALNIWKQELTIKATNKIFKSLFPEAKITKELIKNSEPSVNFKNTLSFKDLGIHKEDIINKFLEIKLLPTNFATL